MLSRILAILLAVMIVVVWVTFAFVVPARKIAHSGAPATAIILKFISFYCLIFGLFFVVLSTATAGGPIPFIRLLTSSVNAVQGEIPHDCLAGHSFTMSYVVERKSYISGPHGPCKGLLTARPMMVHYVIGDPAIAWIGEDSPQSFSDQSALGILCFVAGFSLIGALLATGNSFRSHKAAVF